MGASPVVSSTPLLQKDGYKVVGVIVLDVVEGKRSSFSPLLKALRLMLRVVQIKAPRSKPCP